jgi:hypothetical protein
MPSGRDRRTNDKIDAVKLDFLEGGDGTAGRAATTKRRMRAVICCSP